ncbi:MAG: flagellar protein FliT [Proteobacteria bacterium]|nr:flagellar protein FliT [Pseudomonadota bacterium]
MSALASEVAAPPEAHAELLRLTGELKVALERGDWGAAAELELARRGVVEEIFDRRPADAALPALTAALREVVRINDELIGLAEHRRRALAREIDLLSVGREARRRYAGATRAPRGARP